ncbi:unnamed protein product, partial [marine sediment metagenome]
MAKVKGGLFSLGAEGKIAGKTIHRKLKGIKTAKKYVIPGNPKTEDQKTQRDYLKDAVLGWKTDGYSDLDIGAWKLFASIQKKILSGYNLFLRKRINADKDDKTWTKLTNCVISDITGVGSKVVINVAYDLAGKLFIGTSKVLMLREVSGVFNTDHYTFSINDLSILTKYYFYIENKAEGEEARTGIYSLKTGVITVDWENRIKFYFSRLVVSNWTIRTSAADNKWQSVCWSPELSLFCAVASSGTGNRVMTSPDGITWTIRTSAADNGWRAVCWSPELSLFCAVASSGTGNRVMTSPDGINWTIRTSAADNNWRSVCWSPELSLFCAVAYTGTGNRVMTSPDGITWTIRTSAADNNWQSVCWSPELSLFCA